MFDFDDEYRLLIEETIEKLSGLDLLVLNAGQSCVMRLDDCNDLSIYKQLMQVNYLGYVYPTFYALPHLRKSHGTIAVNSSLLGSLSFVPFFD